VSAPCYGSGARVGISPGQRFSTGGAVRANEARNVSCPECGRAFAKARIAYTDHGIPVPNGQAVIPRHNRG
jgi:hypothetical protein